MLVVRIFFFIGLLFSSSVCWSQNSAIINQYIATYKTIAIEEMQRTGVPASITLAQGIHESMAGTSKLVQRSNNHFGIKCKTNWTGESVTHDDDAKGECFRKYTTAEESYRDHSDFLKRGQRYAFLFQLNPTDYEGWATGLKRAGYATNPKYPQALIKLIEDYHLQDYTLIALGKMKEDSNWVAGENSVEENDGAIVASNNRVENNKQENRYDEKTQAKIIYPDGEFKLNETRVIFVKKGVSYLSIAAQYNIPLARIFEFNELNAAEQVESDQLIFLQRKRKTGNNEYHIVQPGETLKDIAQTEAIRLQSLAELNRIKQDDKPAPGAKLSLRKKADIMPKLMVKENFSLLPVNKNSLFNN